MDTPKTYNALPSPKMGVLSADYLEQLAAVVRKYDLPFLKITTAQRLAIAGHDAADVEAIWRDLGQQSGPTKPVGIHYIQACPGVQWCKLGRQDSLALGEKMTEALGSMPLPAKVKVGISGCPMNCCEGYVRDIGIFGKKKGWTLIFGGNGGGVPRIGDVMGEGLNDDEVIALAGKCLTFYAEHAKKMERTARLMSRIPLEDLQKAVG
ncbi:MAG: hypothetical protein RI601_09090 [Desulfurivibrionaceae bacterium]|nr:hypothetical protein [Desulfurivibrionaceae bacterium]